MRVQLISVGTELLLGDIVNTNSVYLSRELANLGINVYKHSTVGDNKQRLLDELDVAFRENDMVIITGGLGPTDDDITKECVAEYFKRDFYFDNYTWKKIEDRLKNIKLTENNKKQAEIPSGAIILENFNGTAPGIIVESKEKSAILLPGPPREMREMFNKSVVPYLDKFSTEKYLSKYIRFFGIGESLLETKIKDLLEEQTNPTLALYAKTGEVLIRVTASGRSLDTCNKLIDEKVKQLENIVGEYIYLVGDESIASSQTELNSVIAKLLLENNLTISVAESLTGGLLASSLVEKDGISKSFLEGVICYSNESKINRLNVKKESIEKYGAVSERVAKEMASGVAKKLESDIGIAITGVAGPGRDEKGNPVGLVYIAIYYQGNVNVLSFNLYGSRNEIRMKTVSNALNEVRKIILHNKKI